MSYSQLSPDIGKYLSFFFKKNFPVGSLEKYYQQLLFSAHVRFIFQFLQIARAYSPLNLVWLDCE